MLNLAYIASTLTVEAVETSLSFIWSIVGSVVNFVAANPIALAGWTLALLPACVHLFKKVRK